MILTDREIKMALQRGAIVIDPQPAQNAFASTSVDLTLDAALSEFRDSTIERIVDPSRNQFDHEAALAELTERHLIGGDGYLLQPKRLVLAWTAEYVDLRNDARLAARVEGKSSLARLGLGVHITAPTIHAGFDGRIRLEMVNHGAVPIRLRTGMRICQLIFEQTLGTPDKGYNGRFSGQDPSQSG
jgi:dCTP deaminase